METYTLSGLDFSPELNMARYLQNISKYPILTQDEELRLAKIYLQTKDRSIADRLITSHLRLVVKVVTQYKGYGLPIEEMISEGNMGLLYAVEKFDPDKGVRFSTYALWWIKASIQKYILKSWSLVKLGTTSAQKKLFFNLRKAQRKLNLKEEEAFNPSVLRQIASSLGVTPQEVEEMSIRLSSRDGSLNKVINTGDDNGSEWQDFVADKRPNQEQRLSAQSQYAHRYSLLQKGLAQLNPREKEIFTQRRLQERPQTLEELSRVHKVTKERIRQIELNALRKLRQYMLPRE